MTEYPAHHCTRYRHAPPDLNPQRAADIVSVQPARDYEVQPGLDVEPSKGGQPHLQNLMFGLDSAQNISVPQNNHLKARSSANPSSLHRFTHETAPY